MPEPPVNAVKNEQSTAQTTAVPPGIQPKSARNTRSNRSDACPSASRKPVSVNSGIAASVVLSFLLNGAPKINEHLKGLPGYLQATNGLTDHLVVGIGRRLVQALLVD